MTVRSSREVRVTFEGVRPDDKGMLAPFTCAWRHRSLLRRLVRRDIETRFRGAVLGKVWAGVAPLVMLGLYTFVFGVVIQPGWQQDIENRLEIPLIYFSGLIMFDVFIEAVLRAPNLMRENKAYIKKVVFPVEILAWMVIGAALFRLAVGLALLLVFYLVVDGVPPPAALLIPLYIVPFCVFVAGLIWLLASFAVYLRDITHIVAALAPVVMFLSPIFYPVSAVPEPIRPIFYGNPLTFVVENLRAALFSGAWPHWTGLLAYSLAAWLVAWLGYRAFMRLRPGFADVL